MIEQAANFLQKYEGFVRSAMWDVNAWRIGYGSDTITNTDGSVRKVQQTDTTTEQDAQRDLQRRITQEFIPRIISQIGDGFNNLPSGAQIALISIAYNYGSVPHAKIRAAASQGDLTALKSLWISETYNDNKKLSESLRNALRRRRAAEAALIPTDKKKALLIIAAGLTAAAIFLHDKK